MLILEKEITNSVLLGSGYLSVENPPSAVLKKCLDLLSAFSVPELCPLRYTLPVSFSQW